MNKELRKFYITGLVLLSLALSLNVLASSKTCIHSKEIFNDYEPKIFPKTNNLLRKQGQRPILCGTKLIIRGKLLDSKCTPVSDAKVQIWHVGCDGKYPYELLRNHKKHHALTNLDSDSTFLGAGTTITDNNGEFIFITIVPPPINTKAPVAHLRFSGEFFGEFETAIALSKDDIQNKYFNHCDKTDTSEIDEDFVINEISVVLPYSNPLKEF
ncbi:MAG: hypothetical protein SFT93_02075 [Rickettsiaceae bacterium]|nr:hypothetical protein [Rickettsiaceae bacterium]